MKITSLEECSFEELFEAFNTAFADYDAPSIAFQDLKQMWERRGMNPKLSFGAFDDGKLVSFTLNGIGIWNSLCTAYDTGTGTVKSYRGQGLAKRVFEYSVPILKENGVQQYLLEVLQHNDKAIPLYKNQGFKVSREFDYYFTEIKKLKISKKANKEIRLKELAILKEEQLECFFDYQPSWQNSFDAIDRRKDVFKPYGAYLNDKLVGFGIVECNTGDITQIAVDQAHRRKGIGTTILLKLKSQIKGKHIKFVNTLKPCKSMDSFMASIGLKAEGSQFEMILKL